jgi:hypothetical protein
VSRSRTLANVAVVMTAIAAYASTARNYFIQDDFGVVWLLSQKAASYFPQWFVSPWMDQIWGFTPDELRPFPAVSYQMAAVFGAAEPFANHAINIGFHAATALLVLQVARHAAGLALPAATLASMLFVLLPNQGETVAWITGRVDSLPAFFYIASFLTYVRWRAGHGSRLYWWSLLWCFVALFSKQTAITLGPALVVYDALVGRRRVEVTWGWLRPYVPFAVLTIGYLALRYVLFGEVAREGTLTATRIYVFLQDAANHFLRIVFGAETTAGLGGRAVAVAAVAFLIGSIAQAMRTRERPHSPGDARTVFYFGVVWIGLGLLPTLVSTYSSPRHAYLASLGWAVVAGVAFNRLWEQRTMRVARIAGVLGVSALMVSYVVQLRTVVIDWNRRAAISRKAVADLERVVDGAPDGALVVAGMSPEIWAFSLPFAARPPFAGTNLTDRVAMIWPAPAHCCGVFQWEVYTRERLRTWSSNAERPPVIVLSWNARSGALTRLSDDADPSLRGLVTLLDASGDWVALETNVDRLVEDYAPYHGAAVREPAAPR